MTPTKGYFDVHQDDWDGIYNAPRGSVRARLNRRLRRSVWGRMALALDAARPIEGRTALDVGCGPGELSIRLAERGASRVVGIDSAVEMINVAKARAQSRGVAERCHFMHADFLSDALGDERFDYTIALGVFDYQDDASAFLRRMWRHTRMRLVASFPRNVPPRSWLRRLWHGAYGSRIHYYGASRVLALGGELENARLREHSIGGSDSTDVLVCERTDQSASGPLGAPPALKQWSGAELQTLLESVW